MYQINYLPWRHRLFRQKALLWLSQTLSLVTITFVICSYYTYHLTHKRTLITTQQRQTQQQEDLLLKQLDIYQEQRRQTLLRYQHYSLYYQNWLRYLHYIRFFRAIETHLPSTGWISHYDEADNQRSLHLTLPNTQSLSFITNLKSYPVLASLTLSYLQQSKADPSYTEVHLYGKSEEQNRGYENEEDEGRQ
ncbi:fimbrial assembly protein [Proteus sp. ZN5]|uniref:fimbrial assembly protein n=1 Tax=Proteus sp. ZN5 TaxID=2697019 RepID=UPI0013E1A254|nr:fimbrial assembly protein [Proteus sp. ZN5]QIG04300.1 fimbrial assembly protein [Proteus sp. ZN5]